MMGDTWISSDEAEHRILALSEYWSNNNQFAHIMVEIKNLGLNHYLNTWRHMISIKYLLKVSYIQPPQTKQPLPKPIPNWSFIRSLQATYFDWWKLWCHSRCSDLTHPLECYSIDEQCYFRTFIFLIWDWKVTIFKIKL